MLSVQRSAPAQQKEFVTANVSNSPDLDASELLRAEAMDHECARHPFFQAVTSGTLNRAEMAAVLKNYDAHASVLRRLLLKSATIMPDEAVGYILENVRNEYGNGCEADRHQLQLRSLATASGVTADDWERAPIETGTREFIKIATTLYCPTGKKLKDLVLTGHFDSKDLSIPARRLHHAAIAAGAITATELLAIEEFKALHKPFSKIGQGDHIWFDHLHVEEAHSEESIALADFFCTRKGELDSVLFGLRKMLDATTLLYDGLLAALTKARNSV